MPILIASNLLIVEDGLDRWQVNEFILLTKVNHFTYRHN